MVHKKLDFQRAEQEGEDDDDEGRRLKASWGTEEEEKYEPEFMKHDDEIDAEDDNRPRCRGRREDRNKPTAFRLDCAVHHAEEIFQKCLFVGICMWVMIMGLAKKGFMVSKREKMGNGKPIKKRVFLVTFGILFCFFFKMHSGKHMHSEFKHAVGLGMKLSHESQQAAISEEPKLELVDSCFHNLDVKTCQASGCRWKCTREVCYCTGAEVFNIKEFGT